MRAHDRHHGLSQSLELNPYSLAGSQPPSGQWPVRMIPRPKTKERQDRSSRNHSAYAKPTRLRVDLHRAPSRARSGNALTAPSALELTRTRTSSAAGRTDATYACKKPEGLNLGRQIGNHDAGASRTLEEVTVFRRTCKSAKSCASTGRSEIRLVTAVKYFHRSNHAGDLPTGWMECFRGRASVITRVPATSTT